MTSGDDQQPDRVDLTKDGGEGSGEQPLDFDPYRFGLPDHPVPPEYAPPGYTPPAGTAPTPPYSTPYGTAPAQQPPPYGPGPAQQPPPYGTPYGQPYNQQYGAPPGYPPYGQHPYGYGSPSPLAGRTGRGKAIPSMVLGIVSIALCWLSFFDYVIAILAVVFGFIALAESRHGRPSTGAPDPVAGSGYPGTGPDGRARERTGARRMAIAGIACAVVGAVLATIFVVKIVSAIDDCGGFGGTSDPGFQQCVQDRV